MHSSRMCTTRFSSHRGGDVCLGVCVQAVSVQGGVHPTGPRGRPPPHCVHVGVHIPCPLHAGIQDPPPPPPWTEGMTHTCENITLFASGKNCLKHPKILMDYVCVPLCSIWERNHNFYRNKIIRHASQCRKSVSI